MILPVNNTFEIYLFTLAIDLFSANINFITLVLIDRFDSQ